MTSNWLYFRLLRSRHFQILHLATLNTEKFPAKEPFEQSYDYMYVHRGVIVTKM